jgi:hypothetical protein
LIRVVKSLIVASMTDVFVIAKVRGTGLYLLSIPSAYLERRAG